MTKMTMMTVTIIRQINLATVVVVVVVVLVAAARYLHGAHKNESRYAPVSHMNKKRSSSH